MVNNISIHYKIIADKLIRNSYEGEIDLAKAKKILSHYFRIPKNKLGRIFMEMKEEKIIAIKKGGGVQGNYRVVILIAPKKEICFDKGHYYR